MNQPTDTILGSPNLVVLQFWFDELRSARPGDVFVTIGVGFGATLRMLARRILDTKAKVYLWALDPWEVTDRLEAGAAEAIARHEAQGHPMASPYLKAVAAAWRTEDEEAFRAVRWLQGDPEVFARHVMRAHVVLVDGDQWHPMALEAIQGQWPQARTVACTYRGEMQIARRTS